MIDIRLERLLFLIVAWIKVNTHGSQRDIPVAFKRMMSFGVPDGLAKRIALSGSDKERRCFEKYMFSYFGLSNLQRCCKLWIFELLTKCHIGVRISFPKKHSMIIPDIRKKSAELQMVKLCEVDYEMATERQLLTSLLAMWMLGEYETSEHLMIPIACFETYNRVLRNFPQSRMAECQTDFPNKLCNGPSGSFETITDDRSSISSESGSETCDSGYEGDGETRDKTNRSKAIREIKDDQIKVNVKQTSKNLAFDIPPWMITEVCDHGKRNCKICFGYLREMNKGIKASTCRQTDRDIICCKCETPIFKSRCLTTRIGLLLECEHVFCFSCIPKPGLETLACPKCKKLSSGVLPSSRWITNKTYKTCLFINYIRSLRKLPASYIESPGLSF